MRIIPRIRARRFLFTAIFVLLSAAPAAFAQVCVPHWDELQAAGNPGMPAEVRSLVGFDDGSGKALYAGGFFTAAVQVLRRFRGLRCA